MLGVSDSRLLGRQADGILVVGRPDRLTPDLVLDMREALDTLDVPVLGLVAVGGDVEHSAYYLSEEVPVVEANPVSSESRWAGT